MVHRLAELTWPEVGSLADDGSVLAVPLGSTEQHGPHLPLSTDTDLAVALCDRIGSSRSDVVVAPPIGYGSSGEHAGFAGTVSIGASVLEALLVELGRSACETFRHVVLVSAHGGNAPAATRAVDLLRYERRDVQLFLPRWAGDAHAGRTETSLQLALRPAAVRIERAVAGDTRPIAELMPSLRAGGIRAVTDTGVLGDPGGASAVEGETILTALVAQLGAALDRWFGAPADSATADAVPGAVAG